jgi:hypothetical protein
VAADAGLAGRVGAGKHGGGDGGADDTPVAFQGADEEELNSLNDYLSEAFAGARFAALTEQETGLEYVEPFEAEGFEVALGFAFHTEVEVRRFEVGRDGGDEEEVAGAVGAGPFGEGEDVAVVDGAEGFFGAGLLDGCAEAAEGDINWEWFAGGQRVEVDDAFLEAGMGAVHGFAEDGEDGIEGAIVEQAVE